MSATRVLEIAARTQAAGEPCALVTVLRAESPTSARPGDKAVVMPDGTIRGWVGGGCAQPAVIKTVRAALADGRPRLIRIAPGDAGKRDLADVLEFGMACESGGALELFVDPLLPRQQLVVVGTSPVAMSLAQLAPQVGLDVIVAGHGANPGDFPHARRVVPDDGVEQLQEAVAPDAYVVVATQGRRDLRGLKAALSVGARQVSFVASTRKAAVLRESLLGAGFDRTAVDAIVAPAGYPISATTPEEIALSVLAAIVAHRRRLGADSPDEAVAATRPAAHSPEATAATKAAGSCCGSARHASEKPRAAPVEAAPGASCCED